MLNSTELATKLETQVLKCINRQQQEFIPESRPYEILEECRIKLLSHGWTNELRQILLDIERDINPLPALDNP